MQSDQARFSLENEKRLNVNMRCQFAQMSCARWYVCASLSWLLPDAVNMGIPSPVHLGRLTLNKFFVVCRLSMRIESLGMLLVFVVVLVGVFSNISPDSIGGYCIHP